PRTRAGAQSVAGDRGRAGVGSRRVGAGAGGEPADGPPAAVGADLSVHRARSAPGRAHLQPRRGDVSGTDRGDGRDRQTVCRAAAPLHARAALGDSSAGSRRAAPAHRPRSGVVRSGGAATRGRRGTPGGGLGPLSILAQAARWTSFSTWPSRT